jgi:hypothetical protein
MNMLQITKYGVLVGKLFSVLYVKPFIAIK